MHRIQGVAESNLDEDSDRYAQILYAFSFGLSMFIDITYYTVI